ncbi:MULTISPECIES: DUF6663 family protein [Salinibaculum]|uniref:DUF6663 family protein n=1 Tax=Salinibaculum TaxID=2732368 RepID=UPI0030D2EED2
MDEGRYRVLPGEDEGMVRLLDRESYDPITLAAAGHEAAVGDLRPGYLVDATLSWASADPTVESASVVRPTLYAFADDIDPVFEVAAETWRDVQAAGDAMGSRVTKNTDGVVNGVVYVFAENDAGGRFAEFRDGRRPLEPLVDRVNDRDEDGPAPREVFVLRPPTREFVVVTITFRKGGRFADTVRDTYDRPRPPEPLV